MNRKQPSELVLGMVKNWRQRHLCFLCAILLQIKTSGKVSVPWSVAGVAVGHAFSSKLQQKQEKTDHDINKREEAYLSFVTSRPRICGAGLVSSSPRLSGTRTSPSLSSATSFKRPPSSRLFPSCHKMPAALMGRKEDVGATGKWACQPSPSVSLILSL